ncbi:hypothetical protein B0H67DRAFT_493006 [Lasiosphaeris hirsuta]|uniref:Zn(2)-C6 fungal-type domain-containing protein n=1 Tax=Lasiosphaeris hirsuta TaxID=260670 RepID=A0AA40DRL1_9PEZI|nr:hypothetical protein B0H67DRAFT_493006 [Lasiosphaeris hirsuta]
MGNGAAFQVFSLSGGDKQPRDYKARRPHKKTRSGCQACRTKRVKVKGPESEGGIGQRLRKKCDESQPSCARCRRNNRKCTYDRPNDAVTITSFPSPTSTSAPPPPPPPPLLLHHSQTNWAAIFHMPCSDEITALFHTNPLVRTTVLALTASHLRHLAPAVLEYRITEHLQLAAALREYQRFLNTPLQALGRAGVDALVLSAILLNMLAFTLPAAESAPGASGGGPRASWVFSARGDGLGWLALQAGLRPLLSSVGGCFDEVVGFLSVVFLGRGARSLSFVDACVRGGGGPFELPEVWRRFFGIGCLTDKMTDCTDESLQQAGHVFNPLVTAVLQLRHLEPLPSNAFRCFQFVGKMQTGFLTRLHDRDDKALWLLGYWLGIMSRFRGIWWCRERVIRDYAAIRMWLTRPHPPERKPGEVKEWEDMMMEFDKVCQDSLAVGTLGTGQPR